MTSPRATRAITISGSDEFPPMEMAGTFVCACSTPTNVGMGGTAFVCICGKEYSIHIRALPSDRWGEPPARPRRKAK